MPKVMRERIFWSLAAAMLIVIVSVVRRLYTPMPMTSARLELLDVPVDPLTMNEALARVEEYVRSRRPHHVFTADASGIMLTRDNPDLLEIVQQADLVTPDGAGVLLASRFNGMRLPERVSGVDLVERLCELGARKAYRVFFFGAADGVAADASSQLAARYPGLQIAGVRHGYFTPQDEDGIVRAIAETQPDILFVALGIPRQEQFIRRHFAALGVPVMIGVGGSFDVISGRLQRAPSWMQRAGLEWLFRLLQQPSRLPRMANLPRFVMAAWRDGRKKIA